MQPLTGEAGPVVAAFDFDGTLTRRDTLMPFLARGLGWPRFAWVLLRCAPWLVGYALRWVRNDVAKARMLHVALAGRSMAQMDAWTSAWLAGSFRSQLRADATAQLVWHQAKGHACVMVSASPDIYLRRVAADLGFDALLCTEMEVSGVPPALTGRLQTPNCHGQQKVLRLQAWLQQRYTAEEIDRLTLYAYGDTSGDKPMLRLAQHASYRGKPWAPDRPV